MLTKVIEHLVSAIADDPGQEMEMEAKLVWQHLKVFWFSKDNPTGHSERKTKTG